MKQQILLSRSDVLIRQGDVESRFFKIKKGFLIAVHYDEFGERTILGIYGKGDIVGNVTACLSSPCEVVAVKDAIVMTTELTVEKMCKLMRHEATRSFERKVIMGGSLVQKIASSIHMVHNFFGSDIAEPIPFWREIVAGYVSVRIESVSRTLAVLEESEVIKREGGHMLRIIDRQKLLDHSLYGRLNVPECEEAYVA